MKVETFNLLYKMASDLDADLQELCRLTIPADIRLTGIAQAMVAVLNEFKWSLESLMVEDE